MVDEDGIRRTLASYCQLFDSKDWDGLSKIFAEDAAITSRRGTFYGRDDVVHDLRFAMSDDYHGTLFTSNVLITASSDSASAFSDFLEVEDNQIKAVGTYEDELTKADGTWLISNRTIRLK